MQMIKLRDDNTGRYLNHHWQPTKNGKTWNSEAAFKSHLRLQFKIDRNNILTTSWLNSNELIRATCRNKTVLIVDVEEFQMAETREVSLYDFLCNYIDSMTVKHTTEYQIKINSILEKSTLEPEAWNESAQKAACLYWNEQIADLNKIRELFELESL